MTLLLFLPRFWLMLMVVWLSGYRNIHLNSNETGSHSRLCKADPRSLILKNSYELIVWTTTVFVIDSDTDAQEAPSPVALQILQTPISG